MTTTIRTTHMADLEKTSSRFCRILESTDAPNAPYPASATIRYAGNENPNAAVMAFFVSFLESFVL